MAALITDLIVSLPLWLLAISITILGAIWGSFIAVLCSRWPLGESVAKGRSRCDTCGAQIAAYDLVPIFSYIILKGKCRQCRHPIGHMAVVTEGAAALIGMASILLLPGLQGVAAAIFGWLLLPLVLLDYRHLWLPDRLVLMLAIGAMAAGPAMMPQTSWTDRIIGGLIGFAALEGVRLGYKIFRRFDGMGQGDPKLFGALGLWLGWQLLPLTLLVASLFGITKLLLKRTSVKGHRAAVPFGAYLGIAALCVAWAA